MALLQAKEYLLESCLENVALVNDPLELCETPSSFSHSNPGMWDEAWHSQKLRNHCSPPPLPWGCSQSCPCGFGTGMSLLQHEGQGGVFGDGLTPALSVAGDGCQCSLAVTVSQQWSVPPGPPSSSCSACPLCPLAMEQLWLQLCRAEICASKSPEWHWQSHLPFPAS